MSFDGDFYREHTGGSTRLGGDGDAHDLAQGGAPIAIEGGVILRHIPTQPSIIFGGAGSGKFANKGLYAAVTNRVRSAFILDVGRQYKNVTWHWNLALGREAYAIDPYSGLNHPVDLFAFLKDDRRLFKNSRDVSAMALTETDMAGENAWVGQDATRIFIRCLTSLVRLEGRVTPKRLWAFINRIDYDDEYLEQWGRACEGLPNDEYSTFLELFRGKHKSERWYSAVMSKLKSDLDWLSAEEVADALSGEDDYLGRIADPTQNVIIYYVVEGGTTKVMQSCTRLVVGITQLLCVRADKGALPLFYLDEAASCGRAEFIRKAVSEYRKYFETILVYQSLGQLYFLFGKDGASEILESCGIHIYLGGGIRSIHSAKDIADAVGRTTIHTNIPLALPDRKFKAEMAAWNAYWHDMDMFEAARQFEHEALQSRQQRKESRLAIDPAELMRLKDQVLVLTPGMGLQPILAKKLPQYWTNPAMAGCYGPDPQFPPLDRVVIRRKIWGKTTRKFIRENVPDMLAHWPNHNNGEITYVQGYRTW